MTSFLRKKMSLTGSPAADVAAVRMLQSAYDRSPARFTAAYEKLLKNLAEQTLLELTIRREILHTEVEPTYFAALKSIASQFFPRETGLAVSLLEYIDWFRTRKENGYQTMPRVSGDKVLRDEKPINKL